MGIACGMHAEESMKSSSPFEESGSYSLEVLYAGDGR